MSILFSIGAYILNFFFSLTLYLLWLRIGLRWSRVPLNNEVMQSVLSWTNVLLRPWARVLHLKTTGLYDWQAFSALLLIDVLRFYVLMGLNYQLILYPWIVLIAVLGDCLSFPCQLLFYALLIRVLMSWGPHLERHPVNQAACYLTQPLIRCLGPLRLAGFDFTPWIGMLLLKGLAFVSEASMPLHV